MSYSRLYPNNIVPNGTTVKDGLINDDREIKRIYSILDTKASGSSSAGSGTGVVAHTDRQRIISAPTHYIMYNTANNRVDVWIEAEDVPVKVCFAAGFEEDGTTPVDHTETLTAVKNAWPQLEGGKSWHLYVMRDRLSGLISYGSTNYREMYGPALPNVASCKDNQFFFNTTKMKMYRNRSSSSWEEVEAVFLADLDTAISNGTTTVAVYERGTASPFSADSFVKQVNDTDVNLYGRDGKLADLHVNSVVSKEPFSKAEIAKRFEKPVKIRLHDASSVVAEASLDGTADIDLTFGDMSINNVTHAVQADHALQADAATKADSATTSGSADYASQIIKNGNKWNFDTWSSAGGMSYRGYLRAYAHDQYSKDFTVFPIEENEMAQENLKLLLKDQVDNMTGAETGKSGLEDLGDYYIKAFRQMVLLSLTASSDSNIPYGPTDAATKSFFDTVIKPNLGDSVANAGQEAARKNLMWIDQMTGKSAYETSDVAFERYIKNLVKETVEEVFESALQKSLSKATGITNQSSVAGILDTYLLNTMHKYGY